MKDTVFVSLGNQKGGAGKSLITTLFSQYIHEATDLSVLCIDADDLQQGVVNRRNFELQNGLVKEDETYPVASYSVMELRSALQQYAGEYDVIICDLPGSLNQEGIISAYGVMDVVFIPFDPGSNSDSDSTFIFTKIMLKEIDPWRIEKGVPVAEKRFLFNKVDARTKLFKNEEELRELMNSMPFPTLSNYLPTWNAFKDWKTYSLNYFEDKRQEKILRLMEEMWEVTLGYYNLKNS